MPILISSIIGALGYAMQSLIGRALIVLGLSFVSYTGFQTVGTYAFSQIQSSFSGLSPQAVGLLGYLWVDKGLSVIFSAYTAALALRMAGSNVLTKLVRK
jgi:predicted naringenin-chalcone synthase